MAEQQIRFEDGAAYERYMGVWTRLVGEVFLDWLAPHQGLRWIDVGCGNGAFTSLLCERCGPAEVQGIDPSEAQLRFARARGADRVAQFRYGDAMTLPFPESSFDAAVMALVIFFVPDPAKGVAEMVRVVRPGGAVAAYAWDMEGDGFTAEPIHAELRVMGHMPVLPPSVAAARIDALRALWAGAGLADIETREIAVQRSFGDFDEFWGITAMTTTVAASLGSLAAGEVEQLRERVRGRLAPDAAGRITATARANAVKGRVPR